MSFVVPTKFHSITFCIFELTRWFIGSEQVYSVVCPSQGVLDQWKTLSDQNSRKVMFSTNLCWILSLTGVLSTVIDYTKSSQTSSYVDLAKAAAEAFNSKQHGVVVESSTYYAAKGWYVVLRQGASWYWYVRWDIRGTGSSRWKANYFWYWAVHYDQARPILWRWEDKSGWHIGIFVWLYLH